MNTNYNESEKEFLMLMAEQNQLPESRILRRDSYLKMMNKRIVRIGKILRLKAILFSRKRKSKKLFWMKV